MVASDIGCDWGSDAFDLVFDFNFGIGGDLRWDLREGWGVLFVSGCQVAIVRSRRKKK